MQRSQDDLLKDYVFDSKSNSEQELWTYLSYYNEHRPHQGINGLTPKQFNDRLIDKENNKEKKNDKKNKEENKENNIKNEDKKQEK
ncbi:MAG: hypothetical protein DRQ51_08530 [Gammaproteobacteria bacterium]|nr:MAG: hypothetical protein DRQ51_08530 [Gammaproteobacteria bacterium]